MRSTSKSWIQILLILLPAAASADVDLHAHLFMKDAMKWYFDGSFDSTPHAKSWKDNLSSQVNSEILSQSGLHLVVVSLYANPVFNLSMKDAVRSQIQSLNKWLNQNSNWVHVRNPNEAWEAYRNKKHLIVLSLEGASGILEDESDLDEFIDRLGISIVTPLHFTNDKWGGPAFLPGIFSWMNPLERIRILGNSDHLPKNTKGLSAFGAKMIKKLLARRVWVDLSHFSDQAYEQIRPILFKNKHPILFTHTVTRTAIMAERGINEMQLQDIQRSSGIVGVLPSEPYLHPQNGCGGIESMIKDIQRMLVYVTPERIMLGSDTNAMQHLPDCQRHSAGKYIFLNDYPRVWKEIGTNLELESWQDSRVPTFLDSWQQLYRK